VGYNFVADITHLS